MFRTCCYKHHSSWPIYVPCVEWVLNNVRHESTHHNPTELFLQNPSYNPLILQVRFLSAISSHCYKSKLIFADEIQLSEAKSCKDRHHKKLTLRPFKINDLVLLRTHKSSKNIGKRIAKFFLFYEGPFKIVEVKRHNAYNSISLDDDVLSGTYDVIHL